MMSWIAKPAEDVSSDIMAIQARRGLANDVMDIQAGKDVANDDMGQDTALKSESLDIFWF